jgi:hypothetical protein
LFTIKGKIRGKEYTVIYNNGFNGDKMPIDLAKSVAAAMEGMPVGAALQYTNSNHLADPLSAYIIMTEHVFDRGAIISGDIPTVDEVPEGAIV